MADVDSAEMDEILFGSSDIGDMAFRYSVSLFEATLKHITSKISDEVRLAAHCRRQGA